MCVRSWCPNGRHIGCARWARGCPVCAPEGRVGGRHLPELTPEPVSWDLWESATEGHRNVNLVRMKCVDARGSALDSPPQRARRPSAGVDVAAYSSSDGRVRSLPSMWSPRLAASSCPGTAVPGNVEDQEYGQILQSEGRGVTLCSSATKTQPEMLRVFGRWLILLRWGKCYGGSCRPPRCSRLQFLWVLCGRRGRLSIWKGTKT